MAPKPFSAGFLLSLLIISASLSIHHLQIATANDADILHDFFYPKGSKTVDADFFTSTAGRFLADNPQPTICNSTMFGMDEFPAVRGQGISLEVVQFPPGTGSPFHFHPRSAEMALLLQGSIKVGFIDSKNRLFNQTLQAGDVFLFPKQLIHYAHNYGGKEMAVGIAAYGSAHPGVVNLPENLFSTTLDDATLAQFMKIDIDTVKKIKENVVKDS